MVWAQEAECTHKEGLTEGYAGLFFTEWVGCLSFFVETWVVTLGGAGTSLEITILAAWLQCIVSNVSPLACQLPPSSRSSCLVH